jgi:hypothetical protein
MRPDLSGDDLNAWYFRWSQAFADLPSHLIGDVESTTRAQSPATQSGATH